jgi:hypothetical protein
VRKIRMKCMRCNQIVDLPSRSSDGRRCECGGGLIPMGWADELDAESGGGYPPGELCGKQTHLRTPTPHLQTHKILEMRISRGEPGYEDARNSN